MPTYRIHTVGRDGRFLGPHRVVDCAHDKEAVDKAMLIADGFAVEIWDFERFVKRLPPTRQSRLSISIDRYFSLADKPRARGLWSSWLAKT